MEYNKIIYSLLLVGLMSLQGCVSSEAMDACFGESQDRRECRIPNGFSLMIRCRHDQYDGKVDECSPQLQLEEAEKVDGEMEKGPDSTTN